MRCDPATPKFAAHMKAPPPRCSVQQKSDGIHTTHTQQLPTSRTLTNTSRRCCERRTTVAPTAGGDRRQKMGVSEQDPLAIPALAAVHAGCLVMICQHTWLSTPMPVPDNRLNIRSSWWRLVCWVRRPASLASGAPCAAVAARPAAAAPPAGRADGRSQTCRKHCPSSSRYL